MPEYEKETTEQQRLEKEQLEEHGHGVAHPRPPCHPLPDRDRPDRGPCGGPAGPEDHQV